MGKAGRNETKRMTANFLNGSAVAILAAGAIGPVMANRPDFCTFALSVLASTSP